MRPTTERRRSPRQETPPVKITLEGEGIQPHTVTLRNVGAGGLAVLTACAYPVGISITLHIPIDGRNYKADGIIRYVTPNGFDGQGGYQVGIEFISAVPPLSRLTQRF